MSFRLTIDIDRCKGCELCIAVCPRHTLAMSATLNAGGIHYPQITPAHDCLGCRQCAIICPEAAIEIEKIAGRPPAEQATATMEIRIKGNIALTKSIQALQKLARRQGHLTSKDIRDSLKTHGEDAGDRDDVILLFREKGIDVHERTPSRIATRRPRKSRIP